MQVTRVYDQTVEKAKKYKIICHEGGSRSTKTYSIFQFFILKALAGENIIVTIVRSKLSWVKATLLKDFQEICTRYGIPVTPEINFNRADQTYYINGSEFSFFGTDYSAKLHGRKQDWFWINEVMEVAKVTFDQLEMRTTIGGITDYNPADDTHWIFDVEKRPDVCVIKSTMRDNPFLEASIIKKIESYEPTAINIANGTADNYMWEVYGLGNKSRLQGVVFENWDIVDSMPDTARHIAYGLDFGYTNDPSAFVDVRLQDNELYLDEVFYQPSLNNQEIAGYLNQFNIGAEEAIVADSSEPKSIDEIYKSGFTGIQPALKGADSIKFGIDILKQYRLHITRKSINLERELRRYKWREDRMGRKLNEPIDEFNHAIDAIRYVGLLYLKKELEVTVMPNFGF